MTKEYAVSGRPSRPPIHPGKILKEDVFPALELSVSEAARQLGIGRNRLQRIIAGTHAITPDIAVRLGHFCGNGPQLWITMQQNFDLWHAERRLRDELKRIPKHAA